MATNIAEPPNKRRKNDTIADIFFKFRRNPEKLSELKFAHDAVLMGHSRMNLRALRIKETNARSSKSFRKAQCDTVPFEGSPTFTVGSIFSYGLHVLKQYVSREKIKVPRKREDTSIRLALQKLLEFSIAPTELTTAISGNEADFAIRLAQHLLSNLAVSSSYTIDGLYQPIARNTGKCPCNAQEPLKGTFGDTSFGCPEGWHGSPDITIDHLTVKLGADLSEEDDNSNPGTCDTLEDSQRTGDSSVEVKVSDGFTEDDVCQMKAQTIVFSFLQKSKGEEMRNHLIPCIGINKRHGVLIHFYDCVNDILLTSPPLDLYADMGNNVIDFNYPVILFLWLTLNYRLFCSGPTEEMKKYKSTFFTHVGESIQMYETDVKRPCRVIDKRFEEKGSWANKRGKQGPHKEDTEIEYDEFTDDEDQDSGWF